MPRPNPTRTVGAEDAVAVRIGIERQARGWSYDALAKAMTAAGCPTEGPVVYKIEKRNPRRAVYVAELIALATVFGISVSELVTPVTDVGRAERMARLRSAEAALDAARAL